MVDFDEIKRDAAGKWPGIFSQLGVDVGNGKHKSCPLCGGKDRFRFDDKGGHGTWYCNQCGAGDGWKLLMNILGASFKEAMEQVAPILGKVDKGEQLKNGGKIEPEVFNRMFRESEPASENNLVGRYLRNRGLKTIPSNLRHHPGCWCAEVKRDVPAMLGVVLSQEGQGSTLHRTYLDKETVGKANLNKAKKVMPISSKLQGNTAGSAIRLFEPIDGAIGIAEGIETAIACYDRFCIPTWAAYSASMLQSFEPPTGIEKVYIFGDNDENYTGQKAAYNLANKLVTRNKIDAYVYIPDYVGDFLDI